MQTSTRWNISHPVLARTDAPDIPQHIKNVVDALEALGVQYGSGAIGGKPTSTPGSPGKIGRFYVVTSGAELGQLHFDHGTGWILLNPDQSIAAGSIGTTQLADNAVTQPKILDGAVTTSKIPDAAITAVKLAAGLKPSQGAGGSTEALRALGTGPGTALAGDAAVAQAVTAVYNASRTNGQTYTITAPAAGTYILEYGAGQFVGGFSGAGATIANNKNAVAVSYSNVGDGGGAALTIVTLTAAEVVTLTVTANTSLSHCWAKLTRIA